MTMYIVTYFGIMMHAPNLLKVHNLYGNAQVKHYQSISRAIDAKQLRIAHLSFIMVWTMESAMKAKDGIKTAQTYCMNMMPLHRVSSYCNRQMCNHVNTHALCLHDDS